MFARFARSQKAHQPAAYEYDVQQGNSQQSVYVMANWERRVQSAAIDWGIIFGLSFLSQIADADSLFRGGFRLAAFLVIAANIIQDGRIGQTIGRWIVGVQLVSIEHAEPVGPVRSLLRCVAHLLDVITFGVGFLWPIWDTKRQTLADKMTRTVVILIPGRHGIS